MHSSLRLLLTVCFFAVCFFVHAPIWTNFFPTFALAQVAEQKTTSQTKKPPPPEAEFRFNLPHGLVYYEYLETSIIKRQNGQIRFEEQLYSKTKNVVHKTKSGYRIDSTPEIMTRSIDGEGVDDLVSQAMRNRTFARVFDRQGNLLRIEGFKELHDQIQRTAPKNMLSLLKTMVEPKLVFSKEHADWSNRIASFVGKKITRGEEWQTKSNAVLPAGTKPYQVVTTFSDIRQEGKKKLVHIIYRYVSPNDDSLKLLSDQSTSQTSDQQIGPDIGLATISGGGERLIDARTMLVQSETSETNIAVPLTFKADNKVLGERIERKTYRYEFH